MPDIYNMSDVFISYSRRDSEFVQRLFADLKADGKEVWADFEDIPKAADWWQEIQAGINAADAFIFIISPDSVRSDVCRKEIEHAVSMSKRFLPVLHREITEEADKEKVHPAVSSHNWIFFREQDDYAGAFKTLKESIETDLDHNRTLTRLLVRAKEWQDNAKKPSYLLQGEDLAQADSWLAASIDKVPNPTNLHAEYIRASRNAAARRTRNLLTFVSIGLVISLVLTVFAGYQWNQARLARNEEQVARQIAEESERLARSTALAASSREALANNNPDLALVLAQQAILIDADQQPVRTALADAAYSPATRRLIETGEIVASVVYEPDGDALAAGFYDGRICLYNGQGEDVYGCLLEGNTGRAHDDAILWVHMSADGTRMLSSGADDRLKLWDTSGALNDVTLIAQLEIENLRSSALASDGSYALFGTEDGRVGYWNLSDDEPQYFEDWHDGSINVIAINNDDTLALSGDETGAMILWDTQALAFVNIYINPDNPAAITTVAFNPDNTIGVAGDYEGGLSAWNLDFATLIRTYQGHNETVTAISIGRDGRSMFTASWDNSMIEWDIATGRIIRTYYGHSGGINAMSLTRDNLNMVTGGFDSTLRLWHVRPPVQADQVVTPAGRVETVDWDGRHIVSGHLNGDLLIYDRDGDLQRTISHADDSVVDLDLSPDGTRIAALYDSCTTRYYSIAGEMIWELPLGDEAIQSRCRQVIFRPTARQTLTQPAQALVLAEEELVLVNVGTGDIDQLIDYRPMRDLDLRSAAFTPDGLQLALGENLREDNLHLIDPDTGEILRSYNGHEDGVLSIYFSADGQHMVTGSFDNDLRVWETATGAKVWLLEGHSDRITSVMFSPDMQRIISSSNDQDVRLWDMQSGYELFTYNGHTNRVVDAVFSPDGGQILTGSYDTTLSLWNLPQPLDELQDWVGENRYARDLTCNERNLYFGENNDCNLSRSDTANTEQ